MARTICIANQKGGVAKTTTAGALAGGLNVKGFKTLLIDTDPQADLSFALGASKKGNTIKELLQGKCSAQDAIQHTQCGDIIASKGELAGADKWLKSPFILKEAIKPLKRKYDYIIIDTPRALAMLTINALTASDEVIITGTADAFVLNAIMELNDTIEGTKENSNPKLKIAGILLCRQDSNTNISKELENILRTQAEKKLHTKVFNTVIRQGKHIREAQLLQQNLFEYAPTSNPAKDYMSFICEYLDTHQSKLF